MNKEKLKQFLIAANSAGYSSGEDKKWIKEPDGSTTIPFEQGNWKSHDNYFGGEPYGGRTVVFYQNKPVWIMVYYGWVEEGIEAGSIYGTLRNALSHMPEEAPFRGPVKYEEGDLTYINSWKGDVGRFFGEEEIVQGEKVLYKASYLGGLVDQRK